MDSTDVGDLGKNVAGSLEEAIGKVTGDTEPEAESVVRIAAEDVVSSEGGRRRSASSFQP